MKLSNNLKTQIGKLVNNISFEYIQKKCIALFKKAINEEVYRAYKPVKYDRTNQLREKISSKVVGNRLLIYIDTDNMYYYSAQTKKNGKRRAVTPLVPYIVDLGHYDNTGINNMYHTYGGRDFLGKARELIKREFNNLDVQIVRDKPPKV